MGWGGVWCCAVPRSARGVRCIPLDKVATTPGSVTTPLEVENLGTSNRDRLLCAGAYDLGLMWVVRQHLLKEGVLEQFTPHSLATVLWAYGALAVYDSTMMSAIAAQALTDGALTNFQPPDLVRMAWACAKLRMLDTNLVPAIAARILQVCHPSRPFGAVWMLDGWDIVLAPLGTVGSPVCPHRKPKRCRLRSVKKVQCVLQRAECTACDVHMSQRLGHKTQF